MNNQQFLKLLFISGGTLTLAGALTQPLNVAYAPYIFSTGVALLIIFQLKSGSFINLFILTQSGPIRA